MVAMMLRKLLLHINLFLLGVLVHNTVLAADLITVQVGTTTFQVELAITAEERIRGLMFRNTLPDNQGMLFMQEPGGAAFWMKNTYIALDLLFFDPTPRLTQIIRNVPPCRTPQCPIYSSSANNIRYILEINAGAAAKHGLQIGDTLHIQHGAQ